MRFQDRHQAGELLAAALADLHLDRPIVLGLPRGGVPVAAPVAAALGAPLDVWVVRKLGAPFQEELGMGAVAEDGVVVLNPEVIRMVRMLGVTDAELEQAVARESVEVERRVRLFRGARPPPDVAGRTVVIVDDGLATGSTARAAIRAVRARGPARLVLAVPVGAEDTVEDLRAEVDDLVCLHAPFDLQAIGPWYDDFRQVSSEEVVAMLEAARGAAAAPPITPA